MIRTLCHGGWNGLQTSHEPIERVIFFLLEGHFLEIRQKRDCGENDIGKDIFHVLDLVHLRKRLVKFSTSSMGMQQQQGQVLGQQQARAHQGRAAQFLREGAWQ